MTATPTSQSCPAMASVAVGDDRLTLAGLFMEVHAGFHGAVVRQLEQDFGLAGQWFEVLLRLVRTPEGRLRMSDLATQLTLTSSGLTRVIDRMEATGLVRRESCPSDRRGLYAVVTDEGRARLEEALPAHLEVIASSFTDLLSAEERTFLEGLLRRLRSHLNPGATAGAEGAEGAER